MTTTGDIANTYHVYLKNSTDSYNASIAYKIRDSLYQVEFLFREYDAPGDYYLSIDSSTFPEPIHILKPFFKEQFQLDSVRSIPIHVKDFATDGIRKIAIDKIGNKYIAGTFYDSSSLGKHKLNPKGLRNGFIVKISPIDSIIWVKTLGSKIDSSAAMQAEEVDAIQIYNDTILYICGAMYCDSTLRFQDSIKIQYPPNNEGSLDGFLMKLDTAGNPIWTAFQGSRNYDHTHDLKLDNSGNIYLTGTIYPELPDQILHFDTCLTYVYSASRKDSISMKARSDERGGFYLAKYFPDGNIHWAKRQDRGTVLAAQGISLALGSNNTIVAVATTSDPLSYDHSYCKEVNYDQILCCNPHYTLIKTDSMGNKLWCFEDGNYSNVFSIGIDKWDNIYLPYTGKGLGWSDRAFIKKIKPNGKVVWTKFLHNNTSNGGNYCSITDSLGNTYVSYSYQHVGYASDYAIVNKKLDSAGNEVAIFYPEPTSLSSFNGPTALAFYPNKPAVCMAGNYAGALYFDKYANYVFKPSVYFTSFTTHPSNISLNPELDSIRVIPSAPDTSKWVNFLSFSSYPKGPIKTLFKNTQINGFRIDLLQAFRMDTLPAVIQRVDTFLGKKLPEGLYTVYHNFLDSSTGMIVDRDTFSFVVKLPPRSHIPGKIDTLFIIPQKPSTNDTVKLVVQTSFAYSPCTRDTSWILRIDKTIYINTEHQEGLVFENCISIDTLTLGKFSESNWGVEYSLDQKGTTKTDDFRRLIFQVKLPSTGLNDELNSTIFSIYPNPANNEFYIQSKAFAEDDYSLKVYTMQGKLQYEMLNLKEANTLQTYNWPRGIYLVQLQNKDSFYYSKLVVID